MLGDVERDVRDRDQAAELLGHVVGVEGDARVMTARRSVPLLDELRVLGRELARQLESSSSLGEQALRAQHHHQHEQEPEDPE